MVDIVCTYVFMYTYILSRKGLWGVERTLAVIGTGGPVKRSNIIFRRLDAYNKWINPLKRVCGFAAA